MKSEVKFRLIRAHDTPLSHEVEEAVEFGLQDTKGVVAPGTSGATRGLDQSVESEAGVD